MLLPTMSWVTDGATKGRMRSMKQRNPNQGGQPSYLRYCLLAVILFGCYVLLNRFQDDNSATMAQI